jgi:hypothetical protein
MGDNSDEILRNYMENVLRLQQERDRSAMSDQDLKQIALEAGMSEADLDYVRHRLDDCMNRGKGFIRYQSWTDAIQELEQAIALAPNNVDALSALATAYAGRWREKGGSADRDHARATAERVLDLDSKNDTALRIVSALNTKREGLLGSETVTGRPSRPGSGRRVLVPALIGLAIIIAIIVLTSRGGNSEKPPKPAPAVQTAVAPEAPPAPPEPPSATPEPPSFGHKVLEFGKEGIGAGMLTDARSIAVDGAGRIYVAEYGSGRIQAFDSVGNFLRQWNVGTNRYVTGMAADHDGHVYVTHTGKIFRFDGATGDLLGEVAYSGGQGFTSVAVTADGGLAAGWDGLWRGGLFVNVRSQDNLVLFDRNLHATKTIKRVISSVNDNVVFSPKVAVDGLGNIYMLSESGDAIYHFNPQGKFVDKFGGKGDGSGRMGGAHGIAVDGRGRVFVTGFQGVQAFDGDGRHLGQIEVRGSADGLAFNANDELYVVARTKVMKIVVDQ